mgnify:CR=1 FL=1
MIRNHRREIGIAYLLILPFVLTYGMLFLWPTIQMVFLSFTDAPLIGPGKWIGLENYVEMFDDRRFWTSVKNTSYFVALTVVPNTLIGLAIAMRDEGEREAALITFLVTASGFSLFGIGSAFWGVLAGGLALLVQNLRLRTPRSRVGMGEQGLQQAPPAVERDPR